jgi:ribosomal protein S27AE
MNRLARWLRQLADFLEGISRDEPPLAKQAAAVEADATAAALEADRPRPGFMGDGSRINAAEDFEPPQCPRCGSVATVTRMPRYAGQPWFGAGAAHCGQCGVGFSIVELEE